MWQTIRNVQTQMSKEMARARREVNEQQQQQQQIIMEFFFRL